MARETEQIAQVHTLVSGGWDLNPGLKICPFNYHTALTLNVLYLFTIIILLFL